MTVYQLGQYLRFPTALASGSRLYRERPAGAGRVGMLGSNGVYLGRENACRPLADHPGWRDVWQDVDSASDPIGTFAWPDPNNGTTGLRSLCLGIFRIAPWGDDERPPSLVVTARAAAPASNTVGLLAVIAHPSGSPASGLGAYDSTTSTSTTRLTATIQLTGLVGSLLAPADTITPSDAAGTTAADEPVAPFRFALWVGAWCTSDNSGTPGRVAGITAFLAAPT